MALEDKIDTLTTAVNKLTEIMTKGGGAASGGKAGGASGGKDKAPEIKGEDVKAAILDVKAKKGEDAAKKVIQGAMGKASAKLADLMAASGKFAKAMELCEAALAEDDAPAEEEEDEL